MWLFKFPIVEMILYFFFKTLLINSFVVVFPLLPVSAIILVFKSLDLWNLDKSCKDFKTFLTLINFGLFNEWSSTTRVLCYNSFFGFNN